MQNWRIWGLASSWIVVMAQPTLAARYACPTELQPLTQLMLRDLPSYLNRAHAQRDRDPQQAIYAIAASQPELEPLSLDGAETTLDPSMQQVFFTMLERQYQAKTVQEWQQFHWLFLTQTTQGWRLGLLYSRVGEYRQAGGSGSVTPPRESSQSITAQAIRTWLRDCNAGSVKP